MIQESGDGRDLTTRRAAKREPVKYYYGVSPAVIALILDSCYRLTKLGMKDREVGAVGVPRRQVLDVTSGRTGARPAPAGAASKS